MKVTLRKKRIISVFQVAMLGATVANAQAQSAGALLDLLRNKAESAMRDSVGRSPSPVPRQGGRQSLSPAREIEEEVPIAAESEAQASRELTAASSEASSGDDDGGNTSSGPASGGGTGARALFAEIETIYLEKSDDNGKLPNMAINEMTIAIRLAATLPAEYGVSPACVQQQNRRGEMTASSQGIAIASVMKGILAEAAQPTPGSAARATGWRRDDLGRPTSGCPQDFPRINVFLNDFGEVAEGIVARKKALVSERRTRERERMEQARAAAERERAALAAQEEAKKREEIERARQQQAADEQRTVLLRSGKEKPASFRDFMLLHRPEMGQHLFTTPSLAPGGKIYQVTGVVKRQEDDGLLIEMGRGLVHVNTQGSRIFNDVRLNRPISVVGIHASNAQYSTALGGRVTVAVIDAIAVQGQ